MKWICLKILQLKTTVTRMLLSYCKWDKILLMEKFYNDPEKLFKEARVMSPFNVLPINESIAESEHNECEICYAELSSSVNFNVMNIMLNICYCLFTVTVDRNKCLRTSILYILLVGILESKNHGRRRR